jgi:hypothetical protein
MVLVIPLHGVLMKKAGLVLDFLVACVNSITVFIYDGRKRQNREAFAFTQQDFNSLASWPLYKGGQKDLPSDAMVAVGYTLSTYTSHAGTKCLSTNVQFVILLGLPLAAV